MPMPIAFTIVFHFLKCHWPFAFDQPWIFTYLCISSNCAVTTEIKQLRTYFLFFLLRSQHYDNDILIYLYQYAGLQIWWQNIWLWPAITINQPSAMLFHCSISGGNEIVSVESFNIFSDVSGPIHGDMGNDRGHVYNICTALRNHMGIVFEKMSSCTHLTLYLGMK